MFTYLSCATPTISEINPLQVTATDLITITGTGFSLEDTLNEVTVGPVTCDVSQSNENSIKCTLQSNNDTRIGIPYYVQVNVKNKGYALNTIQKDFNRHAIALPHISRIRPTSGSTNGGTRLTIEGGGFDGNPEDITVDGAVCMVESVQYDTIHCTAKASSPATRNVSVTVMVSGQVITAKCVSNCEFTFSAAQTPEVLSLSPNTITSDRESVTIIGTGFGSRSDGVIVAIGKVDDVCSMVSVTDTEITCIVSGVHAGTQQWSVHISGKGYASLPSATVAVDGSIEPVVPPTGGVNGGNVITITGLGFNKENISVAIDGSQCEIIDINATSLTCQVPAGSSGEKEVVVKSNGETYPAEAYTYTDNLTPVVTGVADQVFVSIYLFFQLTLLKFPLTIFSKFRTKNVDPFYFVVLGRGFGNRWNEVWSRGSSCACRKY